LTHSGRFVPVAVVDFRAPAKKSAVPGCIGLKRSAGHVESPFVPIPRDGNDSPIPDRRHERFDAHAENCARQRCGMNGDAHDAGSPAGDDLFDLPSEASRERESGQAPISSMGMDLDLLPSALPKRQPSMGPAGPPLSTVESSVAGILRQVRKRPAQPDAPAESPTDATVTKRRFKRPSALWIAFGALALGNVLVLGLVLPRGSDPSSVEPERRPELASAMTELPSAPGVVLPDAGPSASATEVQQPTDVATPSASAKPVKSPERATRRTIPVIIDASALELAQKSLRDAREDLTAGRRGEARARLGRIGLAIDAIQPAQREAIRAETALLIAQTFRADAEEAARAK